VISERDEGSVGEGRLFVPRLTGYGMLRGIPCSDRAGLWRGAVALEIFRSISPSPEDGAFCCILPIVLAFRYSGAINSGGGVKTEGSAPPCAPLASAM